MKFFLSAILALTITACNNETGNSNGPENNSDNQTKSSIEKGSKADGNCGSNLLFQEGAQIKTESYDGDGKVIAKQVSAITKVYDEGGMSVSEWEIKNTDQDGSNEKTMTAVYRCDGKQLFVDMTSFLTDSKQNNDIQTSGLQFPFNPSVGETLPDFDYSTTISNAGKARKIKSHIRDRKVEAKETLITAAGSFECYKISSVIEAETEMPDMDEESKKIMEQVKKKMGKNRMTFWYAPDVTIIKMEFKMGDKLVMRSEVTEIKK